MLPFPVNLAYNHIPSPLADHLVFQGNVDKDVRMKESREWQHLQHLIPDQFEVLVYPAFLQADDIVCRRSNVFGDGAYTSGALLGYDGQTPDLLVSQHLS